MRPKALVSAYACNPRRGSESGVGWGWVNAIAHTCDAWVLTAEMHRPDIEAELAAHPQRYPGLHFHYIPRTRHLAAEKLWPPAYHWTYERWQRDAFRLGVELHRKIQFDLTHLVTYVTFRSPGHLWKLDIPFVWGPIGALENTPWRFLPMMGPRGGLHYAGRNLINTLHKLCLPGPKRAFRRAAALIAATGGMKRQIRAWYGRDSDILCEIGPPPLVAPSVTPRRPGEPLRLCWSGQHQPGKALPLLLGALARIPAPDLDWRLDILGQGPCTPSWRRQAARLRVDDRCAWLGWLPREDAVRRVHDAHLFVITSLKDLTSTVLLEALSQGLPVICPDHCGFADVVTDQCGIKIPVHSRPQFERDMAQAVLRLARDEDTRQAMAAGALRRVSDFSWEAKARALAQIYGRVLDGRGVA